MNFRLNLHLGDFLKRTGHLSAAEFGAFTALVCHYWSNGHLPLADKQLAQLTRMSAGQWRKCRPTLEKLFAPEWRLPWLEADLADARNRREVNSKNGKKGNEKRWSKQRYAHADRHASEPSPGEPVAIASGSLPHATCHSPQASCHVEEPQQDEQLIEGQQDERDIDTVVPFRRGRA
jgi:uncharacterized protein YdaU (DUF1376 family)